MICVLMFMIGNHYGIKSLSNLLQLERCNDMLTISSHYRIKLWNKFFSNRLPCNMMFIVISDIMPIGVICEIQLLLQLISAM